MPAKSANPKSRKAGRPPVESPRTLRIVVRVSPEEHAIISAAAAEDVREISTFTRIAAVEKAKSGK